ncbi:serine/threonine-protein phosphatase 6 regulatory ankyrin repeat subunit B isoform X3 [Euwallacea fornicatus]|uniref:serine/threonine-protein phosphatase 6 regulatory ankyrin repeat subunit B isoform X3 n=1 Tax=Euwallacea fornicatus TaxID=995702 RepID=UPI00338F6753
MLNLSSRKKSNDNKGSNGLYVHSNPPRILSVSAAHVKQLIRNGDIEKLEQIVLEGQGKKLIGEYSADYKTRTFLKSVPSLMSKIALMHDSLNSDRLPELQSILDEEPEKKKKLVMAKDDSGVGLLHKAVYYDLKSIYRWLIDKHPHLANVKDSEGRTPYFYTLMCKDPVVVQKLLIMAGADPNLQDYQGHTMKFYSCHLQELELPNHLKSGCGSRKSTGSQDGLNYKKSNIRIWIHQRNMANLQQVIWSGHGPKLLVEHSNNPKMRKFLDAVPYIMGLIKDVHCDVQNGDLDSLKNRVSPPVPVALLTAKDANGLTPLHKAVGLGKTDIAHYIIDKIPESINAVDNEGRTPLHYAALLKENPTLFNDLISHGADESALDNKQKTAAYYKTRHSEIDTKILHVVPECPRGTKEPSSFDWSLLNCGGSNGLINGTVKHKERSANEKGIKDKLTMHGDSIKSGNDENEPRSKDSTTSGVKTPRDNPFGTTEPHERHEDRVTQPEKSIKGIVNGEHEIETVNNEGQKRPISEDNDVRSLIDSGNMEQLAALVLNGHGEKLMEEKCDNQELQTFLDNVPVYMSKINRIHVAAREGNLRDLQAALDRRKFAVARDKISPHGATPLHVAVAFGRTSIVRYLAGRFPESLHIEDDNGRTPLHYAAVLRDNGHYYNLLTHLGADNRAKDKKGRTPVYYTKTQTDFNHKDMLRDFGAESEADDMMNDKELTATDGSLIIGPIACGNAEENEENGQIDMPFFATEEGRYLASSLGDPLIKGLTEVANKRPDDPIAYLATYLYNFAHSRDGPKSKGKIQEGQRFQHLTHGPGTGNQSIPTTIDVVTVEPDESEAEIDSAFNNTTRDEHGQSMLHFAAARAHGRNALFQLLLETEINIAFRDELYRTARDISIQANISENTVEIDRYVLHIATNGDTNKLVELLLDGYDHITDIVDEDDAPIIDVVVKANQSETVTFLQSILTFEEKRERVHHSIRQGSIADVMVLLADENDTGSGKLLAIGKNTYGRCSLHVAVLCQQEEIVDYLANTFKDTLRIGDNLERTALHYAMGVEKMESITRVLIKAGAKRVIKDLKGRQPTYYFLNKSDILRLQEEEETI